MATLVLTNEFKLIFESEEIKNGLTRKGYATTNEFIAAMVKRVNQFDPLLKLKDVAFHELQNADKYVGVILDETLNKQYNFCVIPPKLGTRSGFLTQQIFGFISNIILRNKSIGTYSLCDKPVIVINCMLDENIPPSAICNIIGAKLVGFNYIDMFNRKEDFGTHIHTLKEFNEIVGQYKDISKDFVISNESIVFKTERLKGLKENLTNEPYYFAINSYPALFLAHKEGYIIDISEFDEWYKASRNNKNIEAFVTIAKKLQGIQPNNKTSTIHKNSLLAICTKPFLLLAGISGTGKSRIVRELAFMTCPKKLQDEDGTTPGNYCMIEVKPNWHDSTELLGYYSSFNGGGYRFTKFDRFVVKAWLNPDVPFFVCLDEMNLAPVEQYFAEFLSVLETRSRDKEGNVVTGALVDKQYFKDDMKMTTDLGLDKGDDWTIKVRSDLVNKGLTLPPNLIVIGTVNMDDTTYQFSRKVIDRAMTIEMNGGELSQMFGNSNNLKYRSDEDVVKLGMFKAPYINADEVIERYQSQAQIIKEKLPEKLEAVNTALKDTPFQVSYRVLNELVIYLGALMDEATAKGEAIDDDALPALIDQAMDQITLMKILPRIEGDEDMFRRSEGLNVLKTLQSLFSEDTDSYRKLEEMTDRLGRTGFTRFWP